MMTKQEARAFVGAEFRELKRTEPMTRKELKELCVILCDRFPYASATGTRKSWLGPIIGKPCGSSTRCSKSPADVTPEGKLRMQWHLARRSIR
jgi:hypothetical protein